MRIDITKEELRDFSMYQISQGFKGKALVAFIDLLGFRNEILSEWKNKENDPLEKLMILKNYNSIAKTRAINHDFNDYEGNLIKSVRFPDIITFSDSFIFILPLIGDKPDDILSSVLAIMGSIFNLWEVSIDHGFTIRGCIDFGEIYYNESDLVGPSLIATYEMESKIAMTSRVIVTNEILKLIYSNIFISHELLQEYFRRFLIIDIDERIILNPIIIYGYGNNEKINEAIEKLIIMRDKSLQPTLKAKYNNLITKLRDQKDYYNDFEIFRPV